MSPLIPELYGPLCSILVLSCILLVCSIRNRSRLALPPGPKKLPLVGNFFDMPTSEEWKTYQRWSREFDSDIIHLNVAGKSIIILSSLQATNDLLVQQSSIYSDRPRFPMLNELMGWDFSMGFMKYGTPASSDCKKRTLFRRTKRKLFNTAFSAGASPDFQPMELTATHALLRRFLTNPECDIIQQFRQMIGGLIMSIAYGIDVLPMNDPYLELLQESMHGLAEARVPGKYLVDAIPILKYIPTWFPGAGFKRAAKEWGEMTRQSVRVPFAEAKRIIATGKSQASYVSKLLSVEWDASDPNYSEDAIRDTAGSIFNAGIQTTLATLRTFALAMLLHPEIQERAQSEIDSVVGCDRLPTFDDKPALPYITALVKEMLRWNPPSPVGVPHFVAVENEYRGYRIPAGSIVLGNIWAILYDNALYPTPLEFRPERFLAVGQAQGSNPDPASVFGYGRSHTGKPTRACPGQFMAMDQLWITVASILAAFNITKAIGDTGKGIEPTSKDISGVSGMQLPFKSCVQPRSKRSAELVEATAL
ncbi:cytochrome P450 [Mycena olivaceomarginata]|nr:cytochrome P450 [Mycena olivaceomarginata]